MAKGFARTIVYSCSRCGTRAKSAEEAKSCFDTGLPEILSPGTTYRRDNNYFAITIPVDRPRPKTHERSYLVDFFPESARAGHGFFQVIASYDGKELHTIQAEHSRGGLSPVGSGTARRVTASELDALLKDDAFRAFHERASSCRKRSTKRKRSP